MSHCEWKPIDSCPKDGRFFWVSSPMMTIPMLANWVERADAVCVYPADAVQDFNKISASATHWMPLPPPPEEQWP